MNEYSEYIVFSSKGSLVKKAFSFSILLRAIKSVINFIVYFLSFGSILTTSDAYYNKIPVVLLSNSPY